MLKMNTCSLTPTGRGVIGLALVLLIGVQRAAAGPVPMPLTADLDLASDVVVGKITQITPVEENVGPGSHCGRATVEVEETLKGQPAKTIQFIVLTGADPPYRPAEIIRQHKVGERGIWVIPHQYGRNELIAESRKDEINKILAELKDRKWSEPVNGLRAWAAVVPVDYGPDPVIIFAVTNASYADLWVPYESENEFVRANIRNRNGLDVNILLKEGHSPSTRFFCRKLSPGQICYLHPGYSSIGLGFLAPGKYSVVISCKNERADGEAAGPAAGLMVPVVAWQGEVCAPAVELEIQPAKPPGDTSQPRIPTTAP